MNDASTPIRVLVADDHPAVRSGLVALLDSAADITVIAEAADGDAAVTAAREHRPDVVLTDVRMPGATGIEITPRLRETGANVLVISGFDLDDYVLGALAAGADGYLVKSEDPQRILTAVRDVHRGDAVLSAAATRAVVGALRDRGAGTGAAREQQTTSGPERRGRAAGRDAPGRHRPHGAEYESGRNGAEVESAERTESSAFGGGGRSVAAAQEPAPSFTPREEDVLALVAQGLSNQQIASHLFIEITTVKSHISHALMKLQLDSRVQAALWWQQHRP
ncbi:response regulator [Brachybacterium alimentarium]|uniref:response regulator n=1 Tax=Brachybacterium alimentarium TaxID=47845 RepID=UPI001C698B18|nr:response regulator transcription factor [Brachybacterium alimentarium]